MAEHRVVAVGGGARLVSGQSNSVRALGRALILIESPAPPPAKAYAD